MTLHVTGGYIRELEIWTGACGELTLPQPQTLQRDERLPAPAR